MKQRFLLVLFVLALAAPLAFAQAVPAPAPVPTVQPVAPADPIGPNTTTFAAGGILVAAWELFRRFLLPRILPEPGPQPQPPTPLPAPPPPAPSPGPSPWPQPQPQPNNPLFELLRMILERVLLQPQQPLFREMQAAPLMASAESALPARPPAWAEALLEEVRALRDTK